ncbi:hypothetical protein GW766_01115 [Candidatus Parcubacteria bacterium]|nr:hypothetical protein [Candidatus Parcubacteria bacterium]
MDMVTLDGVEYVKASVAAKQFRYTADYIGQLCRGKKVDARLVGRTWFVNIQSIKDHKKMRHQKPRKSSIENTEQSTVTNLVVKPTDEKKRVFVIAPIKAVTRKRIQEQDSQRAVKRRLRVTYELDDENLIPTIHKKESKPPRTIRIEPAEATRLSVNGERKQTNFTAEPLPDVALTGKLHIVDYPEVTNPEEELKDTKNVESSEYSSILKAISDERVYARVADTKEKIAKSRRLTPQVLDEAETTVIVPNTVARTVLNLDPSAPLSFTPAIVMRSPHGNRVSTVVLISPLIATALALLCAVALLLANNAITVTDASYDVNIVFSSTNFLTLLRQ